MAHRIDPINTGPWKQFFTARQVEGVKLVKLEDLIYSKQFVEFHSAAVSKIEQHMVNRDWPLHAGSDQIDGCLFLIRQEQFCSERQPSPPTTPPHSATDNCV
jgi:hypothetical protein